MRSLSMFAAAVVTLALASSAHAGGYVGAGIGSDSGLSGDLEAHFSTDDEAGSSRVLLGHRMGAVAVEASLFGAEMNGASGWSGTGQYTTTSLGVDLKLFMPLVGPLEGFAKGGLNKTWLRSPDTRDNFDYSGRGYELGAGLQLTFGLPLTEVGLWLDFTRQITELHDGPRRTLDGSVDMLTFGLSVGF